MSSMSQPKRPSKRNNRKNGQLIPKTAYTLSTNLSPLSTRLISWLKYDDRFTMTLSVGPAFTETIFRLNSLFDPNLTGVGHQPLGYDQLTAFYLKYRVYKVRYTATLIVSATTDAATKLMIVPTNSGASLSGIGEASEQLQAKTGWATYQQPCTINGVVDLPMINGKSRQAYESDDSTGAEVTTSPVNIIELHACVGNITGLAQTTYLDVTLWFESEFTDPKQLAQS